MAGGAFHQQPNRITPAGDPSAYKTYAISNPVSTHTRSATCEEADCEARRCGWRSTFDVTTELGQQQAAYVRTKSGRTFHVVDDSSATTGLVVLEFPAGQDCFAAHRVPLDRPGIFLVRDGDWRTPSVPATPMRPDDWVDDFATHQQRIADQVERG